MIFFLIKFILEFKKKLIKNEDIFLSYNNMYFYDYDDEWH